MDRLRIYIDTSAKFQADMTHIALATLAEVDALVSWNFKHMVRLEKIRLFNAVNEERGHKAFSILSPREVTTYEGHQDSGGCNGPYLAAEGVSGDATRRGAGRV